MFPPLCELHFLLILACCPTLNLTLPTPRKTSYRSYESISRVRVCQWQRSEPCQALYVPCCSPLLQTAVTHWRIFKCSYMWSICTIYFWVSDERVPILHISRRVFYTRGTKCLHASTCPQTVCSKITSLYPSAPRQAACVWVSRIWGRWEPIETLTLKRVPSSISETRNEVILKRHL